MADKPDRSGYTVETHNEDRDDAQTYYVVTRDEGPGIGAYHTDEQIDTAIAEDRKQVEADAQRKAAEEKANAAKPDTVTIAASDVAPIPQL